LVSPAALEAEDLDELYEEDTASEIEEVENAFTDNATSAQTLAELEYELQVLKELEVLSKRVVNSGTDAKGMELERILDDPLMVDENGEAGESWCCSGSSGQPVTSGGCPLHQLVAPRSHRCR
jgi:hypothetical protein